MSRPDDGQKLAPIDSKEALLAGIPKEALDEYLGETREMCERVSLALGSVEKSQHDDETLNSIYRDMHSIKGSSHLFGFKMIGQVAHAMETALDPIRHKSIALNSDLVDALYSGLDVISKVLTHIESTGGEDNPIFVAQINAVIPRIVGIALEALTSAQAENDQSKTVEHSVEDEEKSLLDDEALRRQDLENTLRGIQSSFKVTAQADAREQKDSLSPKEEHGADSSTVRIPVGLLDNLMNLVGELVLVRNQMLQFGRYNGGGEFQKLSQRLNVVTSELQNDVMKTRMQPIGPFLGKFHRVVRDMARDLGKKIDFKIEGADTELDKTLIEAVKDPLTHLIRNCVDHGIETPAERQKVGKHPMGTVAIRSFHEGGQVIIEVMDDGPGISPVRIAKKAVERGIISNEDIGRMSAHDVRSLIFVPGFSTADSVTDISGRGVGMDVVKTNIEKIGGTIDLHSSVGIGTTVRMNIPLTLAIIPALLVSAQGQRFAIPQMKVVELIRVEDTSRNDQRLQWLQGRPMIRLRGKLLPVVGLSDVLFPGTSSSDLSAQRSTNIVILKNDGFSFGLAVDEVLDNIDIVVKPLAQSLKNLFAYSGATVMGDGSIVLIIDIGGLAKLGNVTVSTTDHSKLEITGAQSKAQAEISEYLIADLGISGKFAVPLCLVNRLEEFSKSDVQFAGEMPVVRYRDFLLPILPVANQLGFSSDGYADPLSQERFSVIVISKLNRQFGLAVKKIVDVISVDVDIDGDLSDREGVLGSIIYGKDVISVIDVLSIIDAQINKIAFSSKRNGVSGATEGRPALPVSIKRQDSRSTRRSLKVLLAEDTSFFRRYVSGYLKSMGHEVHAVLNGEEALKRLEMSSKSDFDLVLTDIEMPVMDGFELVQRIKSRREYADIPVIAMTTKFGKLDIKKGKEVGFSAYLEKFNGDLLAETLDHIFDFRQAV